MGPDATVDLMRRVIVATPAKSEQDHIHMIVDCNPQVPSRIAAIIEGTGQDPAPELLRMARGLETAGATALAMPCNTAHAYAEQISAAVDIPLLNMITMTATRIGAMNLRRQRVGLLASTAVRILGLYETALRPFDVTLIYPDRQDNVMDLIRTVKDGGVGAATRQGFAEIATSLLANEIDMMLIACTELSVLANGMRRDLPILDALNVLSEEIVAYALNFDRAGDQELLEVSNR